jgi:hypothetical protein
MDKLKINTGKDLEERGYISQPAVLFARDMDNNVQFRGIDYVNLEKIDEKLHVGIGDTYNVKYYPIQEEVDLRIDKARGTLTFSSYGNIYTIRAFQDTDGKWASLTNQSVPAQALEEIYMAQANSAFKPDAPAVDDALYAAVDGGTNEVKYLIYSSAAGMYARSNRGWFKLPVDDDSLDGLEVWIVAPEFTAVFDKAEAMEGTVTSSDIKKYSEPDKDAITAAANVEGNCPEATQDIAVNLENRGHAIKVAKYGPMNPNEPNDEFWQQKSDNFGTSAEEAKKSLCGNCVMFIRTPSMLNCISTGLQAGDSSSTNAWDAIDAAELGYCEAFDFKCASSRTCDAWVVGGPITQEDE